MSGAADPPPVVIFCGGRGTRLRVQGTAAEGGGQEIPKPLVEIGGLPILWHVIQLYAVQGFTRFLLATGYKGELIERFTQQTTWPEGVDVRCVDTGLDTPTGGRIKLLGRALGRRPPSVRPTPTGWPASTLGSCSTSTAGTTSWRR